jgi:nickel-dependent lactate racemase
MHKIIDMLFEKYSHQSLLDTEEIADFTEYIINQLNTVKKTLIIPPDFSRFSSGAGIITESIYNMIPDKIKKIIPALGTHFPMGGNEISQMFGRVPVKMFADHNWKGNLEAAGIIPESFIQEKTGIKGINIPVRINKDLFKKDVGRIISIGQVVPHEITGMSNHNKNILIGMGGSEIINFSHYIGAICGMEKIMGKKDNPVRDILDYAENNFMSALPVFYILTVCGWDDSGRYGVKGIFAGDTKECYDKASSASFNENITILGNKIDKIVISLPENIKSLWIGNKAIYRSRMAVSNGGELIITGKGISEMGEDRTLDSIIRKYGYRGTEKTIEAVKNNRDLKENLSAAAHLIHGSSEGRFKITWRDTLLTNEEIESVGFSNIEKGSFYDRLDTGKLKPGYNSVGNEDFYYIANPGQGLWSTSERFAD